MQILNLIRLEKSDIKYNIINFPDGEPHIALEEINRKDKVVIVCRITNPNDLFILMQVGDIFNRQAIEFSLQIYYLMSMRMDRVISFNESFSLKVVADAINSMHPEAVHIFEPHSSKVEIIKNYWGTITTQMPNFTGYTPVFPDAGAVDRYGYLGDYSLVFSKKRDTKTDKIEEITIENPELFLEEAIKEAPFIVIDDLCDGGGTFKGIADEIRKKSSNKLAIWVTHMVNPKGIKTLSENYDEVYFTNSYFDWDKMELPENINVIKVV